MRVLTNPELIYSFSKVSRADFLPDDQKPNEGFDHPLPIGYDQTNSQPSLVGLMLELLKPRKGHAILDVGAGSGWTTALLASVVGRGGRVIGTERISQLVEFARSNLEKYDFPQAKIEYSESDLGMPTEGPFNRILVSAYMIEDWVPDLRAQLSPRGGIMVAPVETAADHRSTGYNQSIIVITRHGDKFVRFIAIEDVVFVPLVHGDQLVN